MKYADAGVNIVVADDAKQRIRHHASRTFTPGVLGGIGVFHERAVRFRFCCGRAFARMVKDWEITGAPGGSRRPLQSPAIPGNG